LDIKEIFITLNIFPANKANIKKAADIIKSGGLVAFPTETVYGLGADVFNPIAVSRIFETKKRPFFDPLIVHIASLSSIKEITAEFGSIEQKLAEKFWPGPLTLVLPKRSIIPDIVTSGLSTVAVRMPANKLARELIRDAGTPIAAPSANLFGRISPTKAEHVFNQLGGNVDMIIDGGQCEIGLESTIIRIVDGRPVLLRHGGLPVEEIEKITGKVNLNISAAITNDSERVESPGQLPYHYSPITPLVLVENIKSVKIGNIKAGLLAFTCPQINLPFFKTEILSETGNIREAAANLFSCLTNLDAAGLDIIYAEIVPKKGLGTAIMDRLTKAAKK
jgi:L-threonylcarbamoyladenylate synthase